VAAFGELQNISYCHIFEFAREHILYVTFAVLGHELLDCPVIERLRYTTRLASGHRNDIRLLRIPLRSFTASTLVRPATDLIAGLVGPLLARESIATLFDWSIADGGALLVLREEGRPIDPCPKCLTLGAQRFDRIEVGSQLELSAISW
jgi:hypothetical protein